MLSWHIIACLWLRIYLFRCSFLIDFEVSIRLTTLSRCLGQIWLPYRVRLDLGVTINPEHKLGFNFWLIKSILSLLLRLSLALLCRLRIKIAHTLSQFVDIALRCHVCGSCKLIRVWDWHFAWSYLADSIVLHDTAAKLHLFASLWALSLIDNFVIGLNLFIIFCHICQSSLRVPSLHSIEESGRWCWHRLESLLSHYYCYWLLRRMSQFLSLLLWSLDLNGRSVDWGKSVIFIVTMRMFWWMLDCSVSLCRVKDILIVLISANLRYRGLQMVLVVINYMFVLPSSFSSSMFLPGKRVNRVLMLLANTTACNRALISWLSLVQLLFLLAQLYFLVHGGARRRLGWFIIDAAIVLYWMLLVFELGS